MTIESFVLRGSILAAILLACPFAAKAQPAAPTGASAPTAAPAPAGTPAPAAAPTTAPAQPAPQPYAYPPGQPAQPYAYPPGTAPQAYPPGYTYPPGYSYPPPYAYPAPLPKRDPSFMNGSISFGLGIPYGVLGVGATIGFDYLSLIVGGGTTVVAGPGYAAGLRLHFTDTSHKYRPHFTAVYGTTAAYKITGSYNESGTLNGFAFYAGIDHDAGDPGDWFLTYGVGYITHEALPSLLQDRNVSTGSPIKFKFAVGYRFGGK